MRLSREANVASDAGGGSSATAAERLPSLPKDSSCSVVSTCALPPPAPPLLATTPKSTTPLAPTGTAAASAACAAAASVAVRAVSASRTTRRAWRASGAPKSSAYSADVDDECGGRVRPRPRRPAVATANAGTALRAACGPTKASAPPPPAPPPSQSEHAVCTAAMSACSAADDGVAPPRASDATSGGTSSCEDATTAASHAAASPEAGAHSASLSASLCSGCDDATVPRGRGGSGSSSRHTESDCATSGPSDASHAASAWLPGVAPTPAAPPSRVAACSCAIHAGRGSSDARRARPDPADEEPDCEGAVPLLLVAPASADAA